MQAPNFSLQDQNGQNHSLTDYTGKWIILYFYPKDDTPGCTKEACSFRDSLEDLTNKNCVVLGISKDSVTSHKKFQEKHKLNFTLLSDPTHETIKKYNSWGEKKFMGRTFEGILRNTYIINPNGEIVKEFKNVNPLFHVQEVKKFLDEHSK